MMNKDQETSTNEVSGEFKKAREKARLTQTEVAKEVGVSVNYYARVERGETFPSLDCLKHIMKVLNIKNIKISAD